MIRRFGLAVRRAAAALAVSLALGPILPAAAQIPRPNIVFGAIGDDPRVLELDIRSSSLLELAAWCRELGLSEGGSKEEMAARLRGHFGLPSPDAGRPADTAAGSPGAGASKTDGAGVRTVTIEAARVSEYFSVDLVGEDYARLRGGVVLSFKDGEATHRISADEILYNRSRNILDARGDVVYEKTGGAAGETFSGAALTIDVDTWTGVFLDGASARSVAGESVAYRFKAGLINQTAEKVTILDDAIISTATDAAPNWSIAASKIWLLPGSEWAIQNAVLRVGEVPLLYIPYFYLPADELVFHPVLGFRPREGSFVQTTTYLLGRPKSAAPETNSVMKILGGGTDQQRRQEGFFLRKTGQTAEPYSGPSLAILFDAYANLGFYLGANAAVPAQGIFGQTDLSGGIALSRTVYLSGTTNTPYAPATGLSDWNDAIWFGLPVPLRYRLKASGTLKIDRLSLSWAFPLYSDPYVEKDFSTRSENMNWFDILKQGAAAGSAAASGASELGSFDWRLSLSPYDFDVKILQPAVTGLSLSAISSTLMFKSKVAVPAVNSYSPEYKFFYPDRFNLLTLNAALRGALWPWKSKDTAVGANAAVANAKAAEAIDLTPARSPWPEKSAAAPASVPAGQATPAADPLAALAPSALAQRFAPAAAASPAAADVGYTLDPSFGADLNFDSAAWKGAGAVRWNDLASLALSLRASGSLNAKIASAGGFLSNTVAVNGTGAFQKYAFMDESSASFDTKTEREVALLAYLRATSIALTFNDTLTVKPFGSDAVWGQSNFQYELKGTLAKSVFAGSVDAPVWNFDYVAWNRDAISAHRLSANLSALVFGVSQSLSLTAELPPREAAVSASAQVRLGPMVNTLRLRATRLDVSPDFDPIDWQAVWTIGDKRTLTNSLQYDPDKAIFNSWTTTLNYFDFNATFAAAQLKKYILSLGSGWILDPTDSKERFRPRSLSLGYSINYNPGTFWRNRIDMSLTAKSNLSFDFQRFTQSYMSLTFGASLKVNDFLDLSISSVSQNSVVFRYFQGLPFFDLGVTIPGKTNPFADLWDSLSLWDENALRRAGFKMKSFNLTAKHNLGDWNATLTYSLKPEINREYVDPDTGAVKPIYRFVDELTFLVQWIPISEFRTDMKKDKAGFAFR
jgi:hypothetical protein